MAATALERMTTGLGTAFLLAFAWFFVSDDERFGGSLPMLYLGIGILLVLFPHLKSFKFANLLEIERHVAEAKQEAKQTREEVRSTIQVMSARLEASAAATVNQTFYLNREDVEKSKLTLENLERRGPPGKSMMAPPPTRSLDLKDIDPHLALARIRMTLERCLRIILRRKVSSRGDGARLMGLGTLARSFINENPGYSELKETFRVVGDAANAAIHGQRVPTDVAQQAIETGERLVELLARDFDIPDDEIL